MSENKEINMTGKVEKKDQSGQDVTDRERDLAQEALNEYNKENYLSAITLLSKLQSSRPKDIKVLSNKAVAEYYCSGLKKTEMFLKALDEICTQACISIEELKPIDELEASVIRFNKCTVLFHLQQYRSTKSLLEAMYNGLESLEESVSIGLCLLLAEVLLALSAPGRALAVVAHTEATFLPQPLPPQNSSTKISADNDSKSPENLKIKDNLSSTLCRTSQGSSFNTTNIMNSHTTTDSIGGSSEMRCSADQELLRTRLHLLRVRALLLMRVLRVAKKELKNFVTHVVNSGNQLNVTLIMLKSQLEYLRGSLRKAVKVLNQCAAISPPGVSYSPVLSVAYYNNMGIIHLGLAKPTVACFYLQRALEDLKSNEQKEDSEDSSLYCNDNVISLELCYNLGVTLLHMNKPIYAFDFLIEVAKTHPTNPRLWLRLAECCIMAHKMNITINPKELKHTYVGVGENRKLFMSYNITSHDKTLKEQQSITDAALPLPTLEFGRLCLRNALSLIPDGVSTTNLTEEQESSGVLPDLYPSRPSPPMKGSQINNVKLLSIACSAYISLCLGDYLMALKHSQTLLTHIAKISLVNPVYKIVGHLYAGEALVLLGRTSEAAIHFDPQQIGEISPNFSSDKSNIFKNNDNSGWESYPVENAGKLLRYNLSVTYAMRNQFDKADSLLKEIYNENEVPTEVIMLALYININLGRTDHLQDLLEKGIASTNKIVE